MKFTAYEVEGISPFAAHSPLMSWAHTLVGARGFSAILGVVEIAVAILIALPTLAMGLSHWQRVGGRNVRHDSELPDHDAGRVGTKCRRLPGSFGAAGSIPHQRSRLAGDLAVDTWREPEGGPFSSVRAKPD